MTNRKWMLLPSVAAATLAYALLFWVAPRVLLIRANTAAGSVVELFRVDLRTDVPPIEPERPNVDLSWRPGSVHDLLARETGDLKPLESALEQFAAVPELEARAAEDRLVRDHELEADELAMKKADARILEIAQQTARKDIEIVRRLVPPSPTRVLERGELPTLRAPSEWLGPRPLTFASAASTTADSGIVDDPAELRPFEDASIERPAFEEGVVMPTPIELGLPELPVERVVARAPVQEQVRKESSYEFLDDLVDIKLDAYIAPGDSQGYFRVRIVPKSNRSLEVLPKDVTFVIDASSSIMQRKLDLTVKGVAQSIALLRPDDRFNVVIFRDTPSFFRADLVPASDEAKAAAQRWLQGLASRGTTNVYSGIRPVVDTPVRPGVAGLIVVASDGRPTAGVTDGRDIINAVTAGNARRTPIYAFGGGNTVNRYLLDLLAYRNKGESHVAQNINDMDRALTGFVARVSDPILVDLRGDYGKIDKSTVFPKEIPDFYLGREVTVYGRYTPGADKEFVMRLEGLAGPRRKELVFKADFEQARSGDASIARNWAFEKAYFLIGEICRVGEQPPLLDELQRISREYGVRTSYTP